MIPETEESKKVLQSSPFAGCTIMVIGISVMLFLVIFSVVVLFRQFDAITKFTGEEPVRIKVVGLEDRETELNRLAEKVETFRLAVGDGKTAVLELTPEEMNLAIAAYEAFKELRGMLGILKIEEGGVHFDISFRLNGKPRLAKGDEGRIIGSDSRYLNGIMIAEPGLLGGEVVLQVRDIEVEDADVPQEFLDQMSPYRIAERYVGSEGIGTIMAQLTDVKLADGVIRFEKKSGEVPKDTVTDEELDQASKRLFTVLGIVASVFLLFVAIIIFVGLRLKKRRERGV